MLASRVDLLEVVGELLGAEVGGVLLEHLAVADDRVERRAQLVGHVGQELGLVAVGRLELAALVPDLPEQPRVLDGQGRLGCEGLEQLDDLGREISGRVLVDGQPADEVVFAQERNGQERSGPDPQQHVAEWAVVRALLGDVGDLDRLARHGHASGDAFPPSGRGASGDGDDLLVEVVGRA